MISRNYAEIKSSQIKMFYSWLHMWYAYSTNKTLSTDTELINSFQMTLRSMTLTMTFMLKIAVVNCCCQRQSISHQIHIVAIFSLPEHKCLENYCHNPSVISVVVVCSYTHWLTVDRLNFVSANELRLLTTIFSLKMVYLLMSDVNLQLKCPISRWKKNLQIFHCGRFTILPVC